MDLLFSQYANPYLLLDACIQSNTLQDFISTFLEQREEEKLWQLFLNKVYDKSYREFRDALVTKNDNDINISKEESANIVRISFDILNGFIPPVEGGEWI